jgi:N-acetylglucosamine-6-sulfatase
VNGYSGPGLLAASALLYLYVSNANGEKELYDLDRDPYEVRGCYSEAGDALKDRLRGRFSSCAGVPAEGP